MWSLYHSIQQKLVRYCSLFNMNMWKKTSGDHNYPKQQKSVEFLVVLLTFYARLCNGQQKKQGIKTPFYRLLLLCTMWSRNYKAQMGDYNVLDPSRPNGETSWPVSQNFVHYVVVALDKSGPKTKTFSSWCARFTNI